MSAVARSLSVLHVVTDRDRRGAQVFATDLAAGLDKIGVANTVVALTPGQHGDLLEIDALGTSARSPATLRELRRRARDCDVVVAHGSSTLLACALALAGTGIPFVYRQISDPLVWAGSWPRRVRVALMLRRAAVIVSLSESVAQVLCQHYRLPRDRIAVIPNAVPAEPFAPADDTRRRGARDLFGLPRDAPVVLYLGALDTGKGVDLVISAVAELDQAHLLVAGGGPEERALRHLAEQRAPGRVTFVGPTDDPARALHAADVLALASFSESMPGALIEAGLCGLPVVTTDVGAITDVVADGETGVVVTPGDQAATTDAVRRLLMDVDLRCSYGHAARQRCLSRFTIETTAPAWAELLNEHRRRRH